MMYQLENIQLGKCKFQTDRDNALLAQTNLQLWL